MCSKVIVDFVRDHLAAEEVKGRSVIEVGAYNVNGSARPVVEAFAPAKYLGVDIVHGPGVDRLCGIGELRACFGGEAFDVVVCTEVMEHVRDWRTAVSNLKNVLKPGGTLFFTTRSPGFAYHGWPYDFWRYDMEDMRALFSDMEIEFLQPDPAAPGVFLKARRPAAFAEKDLSGHALYSVLKGRRLRRAGPLDVPLFMLAHPSITVVPQIRRAVSRAAERARYGGAGPGETGGARSACAFCGADDFEFLFGGRDYVAHSPAAYNIVRCRGCGAVCLNPRPEGGLESYALYRKGAPDPACVGFLSPDRVKLALEFKASGKALDLGCGTGGFLSSLGAAGWDVYGCDPSPEACRAARESGLANIYHCAAEDLDLPERTFDLITFWHTLEHFKDPGRALRKAARLLKDDGALIIESPDFSSLQARFFKDRWFMLDAPRHRFHFEPENLARKLAGFGLEAYRRDRLVNPAGTFISLKKSLMRYAGLERPPENTGTGEPGAISGIRRAGPLWLLLRLGLDAICVLAGLLLALAGKEDSFRIYCKKAVRP